MNVVNDILPLNGLNKDSNLNAIQNNEYIDAENIRILEVDNNSKYLLSNVKGNVLKEFELPEGQNIVIGQCPDNINNCTYYMVYNGNNNHCILRYNTVDNSIDKIIYSNSILNFNPLYYIYNAVIIGELLIFTDNYNGIFEINVRRAYNYTNNINVPDIDKYFVIDEQAISLIKYKPKDLPIVEYGNDENKHLNNLQGKLWQFCYRYIYLDNEISVVSPYSIVPTPQGDISISGGEISQLINNYINISVNSGSSLVKKIEILARCSDVNISVNNGIWEIIHSIDRYDDNGNMLIQPYTPVSYNFYNDFYLDDVSNEDILRPYDYVPIRAKLLTLFDNNTRLAIGNYTEGYNNIKIDLRLSDVHTPAENILPEQIIFNTADDEKNHIGTPSGVIPNDRVEKVNEFGVYSIQHYTKQQNTTLYVKLIRDEYNTGIEYYSDILYRLSSNTVKDEDVYYYDNFWVEINQQYVKEGYTYQLNINTYDAPDHIYNSYKYVYTAKVNDTVIDIYNGLLRGLYADSSTYSTDTDHLDYKVIGEVVKWDGNDVLWISIRDNTEQTKNDPPKFTQPRPTITVIKNPTVYCDFKDGAYYDFGIVYTDKEGRCGAVNKIDSLVYIKDVQEYLSSMLIVPYITKINFEIWHRPPEWAVKYDIVYTKNLSYAKYFWINIYEVSQYNSNSVVKIQQSILDIKKITPNSILSSYAFSKGDRLRFITDTNHAVIPTILDFEILGVTEENEPIIQNFDFAYYNIGKYSLVEIYTPIKGIQNNIFYKFGNQYDIGNAGLPTRYHKGQVQDQSSDLNLPATGVLERGDNYSRYRYSGVNETYTVFYPIEDSSVSDYYYSEGNDIGEINIVNNNARQELYNTSIRFGGNIIYNTQINNLSKFEALNYTTLSKENGDLNSISQIERVILAIQEIGISLIMAGVKQLSNADLSSQIVASDVVLGTINKLPYNYGCNDPLSVQKYNGVTYFFDINKGIVCRAINNSVEDISGNISSYFYSKRNSLLDSHKTIYHNGKTFIKTGYKVLSYIDYLYKEYVIVFKEFYIDDTHNEHVDIEVVSYNILLNKWVTRYTLYNDEFDGFTFIKTPELFSSFNNTLVSFVGGNLWVHNVNDDYNNFYDQQHRTSITVVSNKDNAYNHIFKSISLITNHNVWASDYIYIDYNDNYKSMLSRLNNKYFKYINDVAYAQFCKDLNTLNVSNPIINGRELTGRNIVIRLFNNEKKYVYLYKISINSILKIM